MDARTIACTSTGASQTTEVLCTAVILAHDACQRGVALSLCRLVVPPSCCLACTSCRDSRVWGRGPTRWSQRARVVSDACRSGRMSLGNVRLLNAERFNARRTIVHPAKTSQCEGVCLAVRRRCRVHAVAEARLVSVVARGCFHTSLRDRISGFPDAQAVLCRLSRS